VKESPTSPVEEIVVMGLGYDAWEFIVNIFNVASSSWRAGE